MVQNRHVFPLLVLLLVALTLLVHLWTIAIEVIPHRHGADVLRILPLGDSLTRGLFSAGGNGYRLKLQDLLVGQDVHYMGSQQSGSMYENANEGHSGATISQIAEFAKPVLLEKPDVILLMAGTNDFLKSSQPSTAAQRLTLLIDNIIATCPQAVVIVAQIPPVAFFAPNDSVQTFNILVHQIVTERAEQGKHILLADMHSRMTVDDLVDGIHPNDHGLDLIAQTWSQALQEARVMGWMD